MSDSGFSAGDGLGLDNIGDWILGAKDLVQNVFSGFFDSNGFGGVHEFPAVVISNPVTIGPSEYAALGFENEDASSDRNYKKFKVRIINKRNNPHILLEDPCDLSATQELCQQNALVASHTTIVTNQSIGIGIGSLVRIKLDKLPNKTFNLQSGRFLELLQRNETGAQVLSKRACDSMAIMFEHGESYEPPPTIIIDSDTFYWAQKYDEDPDVPNKRQHTAILNGLIAKGTGFDLYVKTFIYLVWKQLGYKIKLNSGHRSQAEQTVLWNKYVARGKTGLPALKTPGYHGTGMALDFNFETMGQTLPTGESGWIGSKGIHAGQDNAANKMMWEQSGIVQLIKSMGLQWGGDFKSYYDPIHIQWLPDGWSHNDVIMHANNSAKAPIETTKTGSGIGNEYEAGSTEENRMTDAESEIASALQTLPQALQDVANETTPEWDAPTAEEKYAAHFGDDPNDLNQNGVPDSEEIYGVDDERFWQEHPDYASE